jgi:TatA/E family protein of Tat protein translocase
MFGIGLPELILILVIALIAIGPDKLPDVMKVLGRTFGEFKKATEELRQSVNETVSDVKSEAGVDVGVEIEEVLKLEDEPAEKKEEDVPPVPPPVPGVSGASGPPGPGTPPGSEPETGRKRAGKGKGKGKRTKR